jgi:hypothetical protein
MKKGGRPPNFAIHSRALRPWTDRIARLGSHVKGRKKRHSGRWPTVTQRDTASVNDCDEGRCGLKHDWKSSPLLNHLRRPIVIRHTHSFAFIVPIDYDDFSRYGRRRRRR